MDRSYYSCQECGAAFLVTGSVEELTRLKEALSLLSRRCVTEGCTTGLKQVGPCDFFCRLTVQEFLAAVAGLGLPNEIDASVEVVEAMLTAYTVTKFCIQRSKHPRRSVLTAIELSNNTVLHLAAGPEGAMFYKITGKIDGRYSFQLQKDSENNPLRLGSSSDAGGGSAGGDGGSDNRGSAGEAARPNAEATAASGGVQKAEG